MRIGHLPETVRTMAFALGMAMISLAGAIDGDLMTDTLSAVSEIQDPFRGVWTAVVK